MEAELSYRYKFGDIYSAAVYSGSGKVRLWMAGYDIIISISTLFLQILYATLELQEKRN